MQVFKKTAIASALAALTLASGSVFADTLPDVGFERVELVKRTRVSRSLIDYTYRVQATNSGDTALNVVGTVTSNNPGATIRDGEVSFGDIDAGDTVSGSDTFTVRVQRRTRVTASTLNWSFDGDLEAPAEPGVVFGRVTAADGTPIARANILVALDGAAPSFLTSTNELGEYTYLGAPDSEFVLSVDAPGYSGAVERVDGPVAGGEVSVDFTVVSVEVDQLVGTLFGAVLDDTDLVSEEGVRIQLPVGTRFLDEDGNMFGGPIRVSVAPVNVANASELEAFPGAFEGMIENDTPFPIASFGTADISFSSNGQAVQPVDPITIEIPLYLDTLPNSGEPITIGSQIPSWSLNELTGIWDYEGDGDVVVSDRSPSGMALRISADHFSWWNADIAIETADVNISIGGSRPGRASIDATTSANIGFRGPSTSTSIPVGGSSQPLPIPTGAQTCFVATFDYDDGTNFSTAEQCVTPTDTSDINLTFSEPALGVELAIDASRVQVDASTVRAAPRVRLRPLTIESAVNYRVTAGSLPAGITLRNVSNTTVELSGQATSGGTFSATITGTDDVGASDSVTVEYTVTAPVIVIGQGPMFEEQIRLGRDREFDLNSFNTGDPVASWSFEIGPQGYDTQFDENTGLLRVGPTPYYELFGNLMLGTVTATSADGTSTTVDILYNRYGFGDEVDFDDCSFGDCPFGDCPFEICLFDNDFLR